MLWIHTVRLSRHTSPTTAMAEAMLRILVAELRAQGITAHVTAPPAELFLDNQRTWQPSSQTPTPRELT
jgi:hypothetical protein